ncbi:MAG: hypothetical protein HC813_03920 [Planctomycetes bacterium]|nr:hypothetical protein [Planctomycetota bacterium]
MRSLILLALLVAAAVAASPKHLVNRTMEGVALQGYDAVAYFTDGKPVRGVARFRSEYEGRPTSSPTPTTRRPSTRSRRATRPSSAATAATPPRATASVPSTPTSGRCSRAASSSSTTRRPMTSGTRISPATS